VYRLVLLGLVLLALTGGAARAAGPSLLIGATEDDVRGATLADAKQKMDLLQAAGFRAVRVSQVWGPGQTSLPADQLAPLKNASTAAAEDGVQVYLTVTQFGSKTTPLSDQDQDDFAAFCAWLAQQLPGVKHFIVSNEPNLNRYWLPQFNPDGSDAAAPAYVSLLARTYDALKAVSPSIQVLGGAVSPRGGDVPGAGRDTHSPTVFIRDLGAAYRASGRTQPIMDAFAFHPYEDNSSISPAAGVHPRTTTIAIADYTKLVTLLGQAFDGTAQPGSTLPVVYDEFGVETTIPAAKASLYTGVEPTTIHPVDPSVQGQYYEQAIQLAFCQPNVQAMFIFHTVDETDLDRWQSGVYYADGTPKTSLVPMRNAIVAAKRGIVATCPGLQLRPKVSVKFGGLHPTITCSLDCRYTAQLMRLYRRVPTRTLSGSAVGSTPRTLAFSSLGVANGRYRVRFSVFSSANAATTPVVAYTGWFGFRR
jgi:hypothetical protein